MRRNDLWNLGRGCNSRRSLRPDSGLAWTAGIRPRSIGGRPNADDSLQSRAARFGHIDRSHSLRWASPRSQCVYLCRSRTPEPTLRPDRWFLSVCLSSQISQELDVGREVALVDLGVMREGHFFGSSGVSGGYNLAFAATRFAAGTWPRGPETLDSCRNCMSHQELGLLWAIQSPETPEEPFFFLWVEDDVQVGKLNHVWRGNLE